MKWKKILPILAAILVLTMLCSMTVYASGEVANAVENTWNSAKGQIKTIVNNVVFPVIDVILAISLFVRLAMMYSDYRKHGQLDWTPPIILFACLIFTLTAPMYLWSIVGM